MTRLHGNKKRQRNQLGVRKLEIGSSRRPGGNAALVTGSPGEKALILAWANLKLATV